VEVTDEGPNPALKAGSPAATKHMAKTTKNQRGKCTYLGLCGSRLVITIGSGAERGTGSVLTGSNASPLGQVLLALRLADLDLLLLAAAAELFRLEGILRLELRPAMLRNVSLRHGDEGEGLLAVGVTSAGAKGECGGLLLWEESLHPGRVVTSNSDTLTELGKGVAEAGAAARRMRRMGNPAEEGWHSVGDGEKLTFGGVGRGLRKEMTPGLLDSFGCQRA